MELLEGIDLYKLVRDYGPMEAARAVHVLVQVCDALAEAHEKGIVHRDIKPPNLVVSIQGCTYDFAKVLDFGLAKSLAFPEDEVLTRPGTTLGTPAFMAPEAATGKTNLDGQADVYSLGCVAYFLLTGSLVFPEKSGLAMALAHTHETPLAPSARTELPIPSALDRLILQCLAKDPAARPNGCRELAERLAQTVEPGAWTQAAARHWWEVNRPGIPNRGQISPLPIAAAHCASRRQPCRDGVRYHLLNAPLAFRGVLYRVSGGSTCTPHGADASPPQHISLGDVRPWRRTWRGLR
jgi:serine/threonine-protein kinase